MDVKEIALKVGFSTVPAYWLSDEKPIACSTSNFEKLVSFAEALIAEIAKQNEPVAEVLSLFPGEPDSYINARAIGVDPFNTWTFPQPGTKLYAFPPTAEQIANETAWQPIETAPKDETFLAVLACGEHQQICTMRWPVAEAKNSRIDNGEFILERVTHWMPLPKAPANGASS